MSEAGRKIIAGLEEAKAVARGDKPAARIFHMGHVYVPAEDVSEVQLALSDMLRIIEAVRLSAGLGPKQMERVAKAKAVLAKAGEQ